MIYCPGALLSRYAIVPSTVVAPVRLRLPVSAFARGPHGPHRFYFYCPDMLLPRHFIVPMICCSAQLSCTVSAPANFDIFSGTTPPLDFYVPILYCPAQLGRTARSMSRSRHIFGGFLLSRSSVIPMPCCPALIGCTAISAPASPDMSGTGTKASLIWYCTDTLLSQYYIDPMLYCPDAPLSRSIRLHRYICACQSRHLLGDHTVSDLKEAGDAETANGA